jgi:hypothetical protein
MAQIMSVTTFGIHLSTLDQVISRSKEIDAVLFDLHDAEYTHYGDQCCSCQ